MMARSLPSPCATLRANRPGSFACSSRPRFSTSSNREELLVLVAAQPARVGVDHVRDLGELLDHPQDLVHLLLVLGDDELRVAVIDDEAHLGEVGVLVDPDGRGARRLRRQLRDHPLGAVVPDDRHLAAALQPQRDQAEGELADPFAVAAPARLPPDPEVLLPQRGAVAEAFRVLQQQLRERVAPRRHGRRLRRLHGEAGAHAAWPPRYAACTSESRCTASGAPSAIFCPKFSTTTRWERSITTPMSCSIIRTVVPRSSLISRM